MGIYGIFRKDVGRTLSETQKNFIILTGAPGVGKTTVLKELERQGYKFVPEPAREILAEQRAIGGNAVSEGDQKLFRDLILERSIQNYVSNRDHKDILLFDRGIPDVASYSNAFGLSEVKDIEAARKHRSNKKVFIFPPWKEIYTTDDERTMTFEQLGPFHQSIVKTYETLGYVLCEVPKVSVQERCDFIIKNLMTDS